MNKEQRVFTDSFDVQDALSRVATHGYFFAHHAVRNDVRVGLEHEIRTLLLEEGDHVTTPINAGKPTEVRQLHERFYSAVGDVRVPIANMVCAGLVQAICEQNVALAQWQPTEVGYQRYRNSDDWISPHRDRRTDAMLAVTLTMRGSAIVKMYEPLNDPDNYAPDNLKLIDEFKTASGSIMMLRAPGFGNGQQIIHEVLPPQHGVRNILNLRMRPDVLQPPNPPPV